MMILPDAVISFSSLGTYKYLWDVFNFILGNKRNKQKMSLGGGES